MLAASGWWNPETGDSRRTQPLYDPCCGSGTIAIEAAQIARGIAGRRRCGASASRSCCRSSRTCGRRSRRGAPPAAPRAGSRVDLRLRRLAPHGRFRRAQRRARRRGRSHRVPRRRRAAAHAAGRGRRHRAEPALRRAHRGRRRRRAARGEHARPRREEAQTEDGGEFFAQLASHWKKNYAGWTAWVLTPDLKLPKRMRLKESRRVPMWNGPIECRLFRFDMVAGSARNRV